MSPNRAILLLLLALAWRAPAFAQDSPVPAAPRILGKVLVLDSERCYAGDVEKIREQYCVRHGTAEIWLPASKVLRVCPDWQGAYIFMKSRANLDDPDERLRLARWCQLNNLLVEALGEARMAQDLRPLHTETRRLVTVLKEQIEVGKTKSPARPAAVEPIDRAPALDVSHEASAQFVTRIQPILMNTCFTCHNGGRGGEFQLFRPSEGGSQAAVQRNLKTVLTHVRFDNVAFSPILLKAATKHGAASSPPLPGKRSIPYQTLEQWVRAIVLTHPHLKDQLQPDTVSARKAGDERTSAFADAGSPTPPSTAAAPAPKFIPPLFAAGPALTPAATPTTLTPTAVTPPLERDTTVPMVDPRREAKEKTSGADPGFPTPRGTTAPAPAVAAPREETGAVRTADAYSPEDFNRVAHPKR
ncbi:MAG: hypothetical protein U0793_19145 [Gemmataceae bacterium]